LEEVESSEIEDQREVEGEGEGEVEGEMERKEVPLKCRALSAKRLARA